MPDKTRLKRLHAALNAAGLMPNKPEMLASYGVDSSKDLTNEQADELTSRVNDFNSSKKKDTPRPIRRAQSTVLTLLNGLGIYADNGDWGRVNAYLLQPRIAGKLLYEMNLDELKQLANKLRAIQRKQKAEQEELDYLAANN